MGFSHWLKAIGLQSLLTVCLAADPSPEYQRLPPLREQAHLKDAWTAERISNIPTILEKYDVDAWLMSQKEYAEDTVFWSLKPATTFSARRRTIQLFLANPLHGQLSYTWIDNTPSVWDEVSSVLKKSNPSSIALNIDTDIAFSSGLHYGEADLIISKLGPEWFSKVVSNPMIAVEYIATMPPGQLAWYQKLQETAWSIISEGFSSSAIEPGVTTTEDVEWYLREKIQEWNYTTWFHPSVSIITADPNFGLPPPKDGDGEGRQEARLKTIKYGDLLHVDFGVTALGMNTDTQHLAYVLQPGGTKEDVPEGLKDGLKKVNRLQDIVKANMVVGKTGNEILKYSLKQAENEGIYGRIYCHPIGDWGHSAGTLIGILLIFLLSTIFLINGP